MAAAETPTSLPVVGHGCVVCLSTARGRKLLDCLHVGCVDCLRANIRDDGTVACPADGCNGITSFPPSSGFVGLESLPNMCLERSATVGRQQILCDECPNDEPKSATQKCLDCSILLCHFHVQYHSRSRRTVGHRLTEDLSTPSQSRQLQFCRLHSSGEVTTYCDDCNRLLCKRCLDLGLHVSHDYAPIAKAARLNRSVLRIILERTERTEVVAKSHSCLVKVSESLRHVEVSADEHLKAIARKKRELLQMLAKEEECNVAEVRKILSQKQQALKFEEQKLKKSLALAHRAMVFSHEAVESLRDIELLDVYPVLSQRLVRVHNTAEDLTKELSSREHYLDRVVTPTGFEFSATWKTEACAGSTSRPLNVASIGAYESVFPFHFDEQFCGENLSISECGLKVSANAESSVGASVVGSVGFLSGCHRWEMLLDVKTVGRFPPSIHVGVTDEPQLLSSKHAWVWRTAGARKLKGSSKWKNVLGMSRWETGNRLSVKVDFTDHLVICVELKCNQGESHPLSIDVIKIPHSNVLVSGKLYPYFYINHGQSLTLLPCTQIC